MAGVPVQPSKDVQVLYGLTKGALASIIARAVSQELASESYHQELSSFFILPRAMLPLFRTGIFGPRG
jgi:hypothetical protein